MKVFVKILMVLALLAIVDMSVATAHQTKEGRNVEKGKDKSWLESNLGWADVRNAINDFGQSAFKVASDCYTIVQDLSNPEYVVLRNLQQNHKECKLKQKLPQDDGKFNVGLRLKTLPG